MSNRLSDPCESPGHLDLKLTNRHSGLPPVHTAKHSPSRSIRHGSAPSYTYMMGEDSTPDFLQIPSPLQISTARCRDPSAYQRIPWVDDAVPPSRLDAGAARAAHPKVR